MAQITGTVREYWVLEWLLGHFRAHQSHGPFPNRRFARAWAERELNPDTAEWCVVETPGNEEGA